MPDEPKLPQTGAGSRWSLAGILGAAGMILLLFGIFSKKKYHGKREA
ncbi:MAG: LPXTG cell wall anchor domain-containing protein [Oscillibacter sp.]|nr:LPXTG cell wall anchor domain-containing protein [Oscillibacter sp.]